MEFIEHRHCMKFLNKCAYGFAGVIACLLIATIAVAQPDPQHHTTLKLVTMDLPPYGWVDEQGKPHGIIYELTEEIGKRSGLAYTHKIRPFSRMLLELKYGKVDLLSSLAHEETLSSGEKLAIQFHIDVIAGTKKGSDIQHINDFQGKDMAYPNSAFYPQLEGIPKKISYAKGYKQVLKMLHQRPNIQGAVFSEPAYYYWMQDANLSPDDFGRVITIEADKPQWIFVRKGLPEQLRVKLNRVVEDIYNEGMYEALLVKYGKI